MSLFAPLVVTTLDSLNAFSLLAQSNALPALNVNYWLMLVSRVLHIVGAIILAGGLFYLYAVVTPAVPTSAAVDQHFGGRRAAWSKWVGIATLLLLVTGLWNYVQGAKQYDLAKSYHMVAGMKMLTGLALFFLAALLAGRSAAAEQVRQKMPMWLRVALGLAIVTVVLGAVLRTYPHNPKSTAEPPALSAPANSVPAN